MRRSVSRATAALIVALLPLLARGAATEQAGHDYVELIRAYARGERALAVGRLAAIPEEAQRRAVAALVELAAQAERRPHDPGSPEFVRIPFRAAVMLHADRDRADRPRPSSLEHPRACPGAQAAHAGRYAPVLARRQESRDFARRFYLAMALAAQQDACFDDAKRWARDGLELFARDAELHLALGGVHEEDAVLSQWGAHAGAFQSTRAKRVSRGLAAERTQGLHHARSAFQDAVASDPTSLLGHVRLGRVHWRLGGLDEARAALEAAAAITGDPRALYLAHLFLGRVHEDAGRLAEAQREYRLALDLDPEAQVAAVALSHALRRAGDLPASREVLASALARAGKRSQRDAAWDYLVSHPDDPDQLFAELRRESLE